MSELHYEGWEPIIGLEIHVQLKTQTKLFSASPNQFGEEPNTNIDPTNTGLPGSLPVLNGEAVKKAVLFGLAIDAEVNLFSTFDRKSYFYPDSPRNFQITQFYHPILSKGTVTCDVGGTTHHFAIHHAHLEDDAGMLKHFNSFTGIDYNRAGCPLLEIVSEPCMRSPKEASAYASSVKAIMQYLGASDCNMEEGSLRIDVNVSVRSKGEKGLRPKIEIKNLNSFHYMELAIEAEIRRQVRAYSRNPNGNFVDLVQPGTYRFDVESKQTLIMRKKESADDYRYFPEPDLPPLILHNHQIEELKKQLPELPHQRFMRYMEELHLSPMQSAQLTQDKFLSDYFERALLICNNPSSLCNWLNVEFGGRFKEKGISLESSQISSENIGKLIQLIDSGTITGKIAKMVADEMVAHPERDCAEIIRSNSSFTPVSDLDVIEPIVDRILAENSQSVADFKAGKSKAFAFLVGQVMKETKGKASPQIVNDLLKRKIDH